MGLKRREFLRRASGILAGLGISESIIGKSSQRYYQALAAPTSGKLALLVGINAYPGLNALSGCVTDVELQRQLLIYRFGFNPRDIVTLTDGQATRANIEEAFVNHLGQQATNGDLVVFHFSGYGRRINWDQSTTGLQTSLMPVDGGSGSGGQPANDILEATLWELLRSLKTDRAIAVLDTSYSYPGTNLQGNLRIRSQQGVPTGNPSDAELAFLESISPKPTLLFPRSPSSLKGVVLAASGANQLATEGRWNGFSAGVFTYALTQQLWLATPANTLQSSLQKAAGTVQQIAGFPLQQPQLLKTLEAPPSGERNNPPDETLPDFAFNQPSAEGAITALEDNGQTAVLWLGGLPIQAIESLEVSSILTPVPLGGTDAPSYRLQVRSRDGLTVKAQLLGIEKSTPESSQPLEVGQVVQEEVRTIARNINLTIALDAGLQRIERVDATSAFAAIPRVTTVIAAEQPADYLFGRAQEAMFAQLPSSALPIIPPGSYALFSLGKNLLLNTMGEQGEAIKSSAQRLVPQLQTLLANKLLRLTANEGSSRLGVRVNLETLGPEAKAIVQRETPRAPWEAPKLSAVPRSRNGNSPLGVPLGSRIRYRAFNYSDRPLYCLLFSLDNSGNAVVLYPSDEVNSSNTGQTQPSLEQNLLLPGETLTIPTGSGTGSWVVHGQAGLTETQVIFSSSPFAKTFSALSGVLRPQGDAQPLMPVTNSLAIAQAILQDLHTASIASLPNASTSPDRWALHVDHWATLSFIYRAI
ncbi:caspase family protein [Laspinema olomoucense]|uniref:caspase family protein n=1 Tax=Laspinema olomoucense TaxID=3231600 RepID=UPI0021BB7EFC|nr:caspase family protein [Laspinema sp. D3d]MCT7975701.1 caspase family protein [Laspinema sp. D3d]